MKARSRTYPLVAAAAAAMVALAACGGSSSGGSEGGDNEPVRVGVLVPLTGALSSFSAGYQRGMEIGLDYATNGTGEVNGHPVKLEFVDDGTDPTKAVAAATDLVGSGVKILAGTISSGVSVPVATFAGENDVLFINGGASTDAITGLNRNTFRADRGTYQEIANVASAIPEPPKTVTVLAQDNVFGKDSAAAATTVFEKTGARVTTVTAPAAGTDFTTFAKQILDSHPDVLYVIWAGPNLGSVWKAVDQQGILDSDTTVATVVGSAETWPAYPEDSTSIVMGSPYIPGFGSGKEADALNADVSKLNVQSSFGFATSQMIVRALTEGSADDTESMITALEGWKFGSPKGATEIRAEDHATIEPMYIVRLDGPPSQRKAELVSTTPAESVIPPVAKASWSR